MSQASKPTKFQILDVSLITIAHHIHDVYTAFLAPVQMILIEKLGMTHFLFGALSFIQRIPSLFNPWVGIMAEKVRIRYVMIVAPTITAVSMGLIGIAPNYLSLAALIFISGIGSTLFHVPTPVMMRQVSGRKIGRGMSLYMVGGESARTIGPIVIIGAIDLWGFEGTFRLIPAGVLSSILLFIRFRNMDLRKHFMHAPYEGSYAKVFRKFSRILIVISAITLFRGFMKSLFTYYLVGHLEYEGISRTEASFALSLVYVTGTIGVLVSGTSSDYFGKRNTLLLIALASPILMLLFGYMRDTSMYLILGVIGFFLLAPTPIFLSIINSLDSKHFAFLNGIYMTSNLVVGALTTMLVGLGYDLIGYELSYQIANGLAFLMIPICFFIPKENR